MRATAFLGLLALGCDKEPSATKSGPSQAPPPAPSVSAPAVVDARLGCVPITSGGHALGPSAGEVTIAAANGKALVVGSADGEAGSASRLLRQDGRPDSAPEPIAGRASATTFEGELAAIACAGDVLSVRKGGGEPKALGECRGATSLRARARGDLVVAAWADAKGLTVWAGGPKPLRVDERAEAPGVAVGDTWGAVAWRSREGELRVLRVERGASKVDKPLTVDRGVLGAPSLAFEGDALHVVWSARVADAGPPVLRWSKWTGKAAILAPQTLSTRSAATSPSLAVQPNGMFLLAWVEGDAVRAGASHVNILRAVTNANEVSGAGASASDPAVALDGPAMFVAWRERGEAGAALRAVTLRCLD